MTIEEIRAAIHVRGWTYRPKSRRGKEYVYAVKRNGTRTEERYIGARDRPDILTQIAMLPNTTQQELFPSNDVGQHTAEMEVLPNTHTAPTPREGTEGGGYVREDALALLFKIGQMIFFSEDKVTSDEIAQMVGEENWRSFWHKQSDWWIQSALRKWQLLSTAILAQQTQHIQLLPNTSLWVDSCPTGQEIERLAYYSRDNLEYREAHDQVRRALLRKWADERNAYREFWYTSYGKHGGYTKHGVPTGFVGWMDFLEKATQHEIYCCFVQAYAHLPLEHYLEDAARSGVIELLE